MKTIIPNAPRGFTHVPGIPGYAVSRSGRVMTCRVQGFGLWHTSKWHWRELHLKPRGRQPGGPFYYWIQLRVTNIAPLRLVGVHQMVLRTFIGPRPKGKESRHKNGIGIDNRLRNLRWSTPTANAHDKIRHGTNSRKLTVAAVRAIRRSPGLWGANAILATKHGVTSSTISRVRSGRRWKGVR